MASRSLTSVARTERFSFSAPDGSTIPEVLGITGPAPEGRQVHKEVMDLSKGQMIFGMGDPANGIYVVNSGPIKIYRLWEDGREITLAIVGAGDIFGEEALVSRNGFTTFAETLEQCSIVFIRRDDVLLQIAQRPTLATALMQLTGERLMAAQQQVENLAFRRVTSRVADLLLRLAQLESRADEGEIAIHPGLTHQQMASLVGTTRETFTSTLSKLAQMNIVRSKRRTLYILDLPALEEFC